MEILLNKPNKRGIEKGCVITFESPETGNIVTTMVVAENPSTTPRLLNLSTFVLDSYEFQHFSDIEKTFDILNITYPEDLLLTEV